MAESLYNSIWISENQYLGQRLPFFLTIHATWDLLEEDRTMPGEITCPEQFRVNEGSTLYLLRSANSYIRHDSSLNHWWWLLESLAFAAGGLYVHTTLMALCSMMQSWGFRCSHGVFRLYRLFLNLTITWRENNKVYCQCITWYASRFSYIQSAYSIAFLIQEIKQDICTFISHAFTNFISKSRRSNRWEVSYTKPDYFIQGDVVFVTFLVLQWGNKNVKVFEREGQTKPKEGFIKSLVKNLEGTA